MTPTTPSKRPSREDKPIVRVKISLQGTDPEVWRRVEVPSTATLKQFHAIIQAAMGWDDDHLYRFERGRASLSSGRRLTELVAARVKIITYIYDFGDEWRHHIEIEAAVPAAADATYPRLIEGAGQCPPEDVGGAWGYYESLKALADPRHENHELMLDWYGEETFDPAAFDRTPIDRELRRVAGYLARSGRKP